MPNPQHATEASSSLEASLPLKRPLRLLHILNHLSDRGNGIINLAVDLAALLAEAPLNNISAGPVAFLVWCVIGFCLAQRETVDEQGQQGIARLRSSLRNREAVAS